MVSGNYTTVLSRLASAIFFELLHCSQNGRKLPCFSRIAFLYIQLPLPTHFKFLNADLEEIIGDWRIQWTTLYNSHHLLMGICFIFKVDFFKKFFFYPQNRRNTERGLPSTDSFPKRHWWLERCWCEGGARNFFPISHVGAGSQGPEPLSDAFFRL